ncbi:MAG: aminotransferase class III-fold pyridoxal phosphate-dependent enzyme [Sulfolobales archaeon]
MIPRIPMIATITLVMISRVLSLTLILSVLSRISLSIIEDVSRSITSIGVKPSPYAAGHPRKPRSVPAGFPLPAIPKSIADTVVIAPWNDLGAVEDIMREHGNDIAAIILEPVAMNMGVVPADKDFIVGLRRIADEYNSVLIFDEVKTSGMWFRGASEYYGVRADIIAVAKALGGGFPFSAVLADRKFMDLIGPRGVPHGGTFNANILSVYAAYVTVTELLTESNLAYTHKLSSELAKGYRDLIEDLRIEAHVVQIANKGTIYFSDKPIKNWRDFVEKVRWGVWYNWVLGMVVNGIIPQPMAYDEQWTISIAHTREDIEKTIEIAGKVFREVREGRALRFEVEEAI